MICKNQERHMKVQVDATVLKYDGDWSKISKLIVHIRCMAGIIFKDKVVQRRPITVLFCIEKI